MMMRIDMRHISFIFFCILYSIITVPNATHAAAGDMAIYRDSNGTQETNNAEYTGVPFNVIQREDSIFTQNANDIDVDIGETGRYLFGYIVQARNDTYGNRIAFRSRVTLAGSEQYIGQGQGYRRNKNNDRFYTYGYGIVNATAGDDLRVEVIRQGIYTDSHLMEANRSSLWILKLDDSWDYLRLQGADNQATTVALQDINFTTLTENTNSNVFGHDIGTNPNEITLKKAGHYLVAYNVGIDGSTNRTSMTTNLSLDGTPVEQSYDYVYLRNSNSTNQGTATNLSIISALANNILTVEWGATGAYSAYGTDTRSDRTGITIVKLPDYADYLRVHETTDGQDVGGLNNVITFDTQDEADPKSFSYNTTSGVTTIQRDGNYLFTSGARSNRGTSGTSRLTSAGSFYVDGVRQTVGNTGMYVRGDQGTADTFDGGWSAAGLFDLSSTDTIDFRQIDEGDNGNSDVFQSDSYGLTAVNLDTLFRKRHFFWIFW